MKSVLFVIQEYSQGGINKCLENLLPFMTKSYLVSIFCMYEDGGDYYKRVFAPYVLRKSLLYYLLHDNVYTRKAMGLYNKITGQNHFSFLYKYEAIFQQKRKDVDVIVAYHEGMTAEFVSYFPKGRKIAWLHCDPYFWGEANFLRYKSFYEKIDCIVCVSNAVKSSLTRIFGKYEGKIVSIHNVVNSEELKKKSLEAIHDFQNHNNEFRIISIGRSAKVKQFEKIPGIIRKMLDKGCNRVQWYIMSSGHELDTEIGREIEKCGVGEYVFLMGERNNPYPYIAKADLLVSTSYSEAYPTVINEAQVLNVPVVANDYPSAYEIVNRNCGFICSLKDMPELLSEIVNDKDGVYSMAKSESKAFVYNNDEILDSIKKLFEIY